MTPKEVADAVIGTFALHMPEVYLKAQEQAAEMIRKAVQEERARTMQLIRDCCCANRCEMCVAAVEAMMERRAER